MNLPQNYIDDLIRRALAEDITYVDITTDTLMPDSHTSEAYYIAKDEGVLCGMDVALRVFDLAGGNVETRALFHDGDKVCKGDILATMTGSTKTLLKGERTALNLLQHMSGIATATNRSVHLVEGTRARITDTRKTLPGMRALQKYAVVVGGGRIAYYLARQLIETGIHVKIIEKDEKRCNQLFDLLPKATILHGDGTDHELLSEEGLDKTDALIALTGIDEENIILSMYANSLNVDKVVTKVNNARLAEMLAPMGIESVISPKEIAANRIISYVRAMTNATGSNVEMLYRLADNKVEALEFRVRESSRCIGVPLKDMPIKDDVLVGAIIRGGACIIPGGDDVIKAHDSVIVVTTMNGLHELDNILKEKE